METASERRAVHRPLVVSHAEWLVARRALLTREKEATRRHDQLVAARRRLPMVRVARDYAFVGPRGPATLRDLFGRHRQLLVYHFLFAPEWSEGCRCCSFVMDALDGSIVHLAARDTAFAVVSRASIDRLEAFRARMEWDFDWYSCGGSDFSRDFPVTLDESTGSVDHDDERAAALHERRTIPSLSGELPGMSAFLRDGDDVYHTYSTRQRGLDGLIAAHDMLDLTILGRDDAGRPMAWVRHHDRYPA